MTAAEKRSRISQKKRLGQPAGKPRRVKSLKRRKKVMSHCKPRKAMGGAMSMPTRNSKGPMRTRFKMGGGNFPDLSGDGNGHSKKTYSLVIG